MNNDDPCMFATPLLAIVLPSVAAWVAVSLTQNAVTRILETGYLIFRLLRTARETGVAFGRVVPYNEHYVRAHLVVDSGSLQFHCWLVLFVR